MKFYKKPLSRYMALIAAALLSTASVADEAATSQATTAANEAASEGAAGGNPTRGYGPGVDVRRLADIDRLMMDAHRASAQGDNEQAEKFILQAAEISPRDPRLQWELAGFYESIGENEKADAARVKSLSMMPAEQRDGQVRSLEKRIEMLDKEKAQLEKMLGQLKAAGS